MRSQAYALRTYFASDYITFGLRLGVQSHAKSDLEKVSPVRWTMQSKDDARLDLALRR